MYQLFFLAILFTGCELDEDKFEEQYADAFCEWLDGCAKISSQHGTMDTCITTQKIFADEILTPDECEFDQAQAKECLKEIAENDDCSIEDSIPNECLEASTCTSQDTGE